MKTAKLFFKPFRENLIALLLFLLFWWVISLFFDPYILPSPVDVLSDLGTFHEQGFLQDLKVSLGRILTGFVISFLAGTFIGIVSYALRISSYLETLLVMFQVLPGLILGIIFLLIFGVGNTAPIALIVFLNTPLLAINTTNTLLKKNHFLEKVIRAYKGKTLDIIRDLYIPSLVPAMKTNTTIGLVMAVKIVVLGEFIASENGIGYLLNVSKVYFDMKAVFFYLTVVIVMIVFFQITIHLIFALVLRKYLYKD